MSSSDNSDQGSMFRPHQAPSHKLYKVKPAKYSTSLDPRGYIPVYEYVINDQPIMWDRETGYVHFTGIWKALGNSKADIVKMVDYNPELNVKKIRGGFLKIQGTWIPFEYAQILCKRTAFNIRKELVPIFGPKFPLDCLEPNHPEFNSLQLPGFERPNKSNRLSTMSKLQISQSSSIKMKKRKLPPLDDSSSDDYGSERIVKSMSLSRLLNHDNGEKRFRGPNNRIGLTRTLSSSSGSDTEYTSMSIDSGSDHEDLSSNSSASSPASPVSPYYTGSPSFHIVSNDFGDNHYCRPAHYASSYCDDHSCYLPPLKPRPVYPYQTLPSMKPRSQEDLIETINAGLLLRRLSEDDGMRPFKPFQRDVLPSSVVVGGEEFKICWN